MSFLEELRHISDSCESKNVGNSKCTSFKCASPDCPGRSKGNCCQETFKKRELHNPFFLLLVLCLLAATCWFWRQLKLNTLLPSPSILFSFRLPAEQLKPPDLAPAETAELYALGAPGAAPRMLKAEDDAIQTASGTILIAPTLSFFCFLFFFAIFLQWLVSKIPVYPPPVSIIWFVFGMAAYGVAAIPALLPEQPWEKQGGGGGGGSPASYQPPTKGHNILQTAILEMRFIDSSVVYYVMMPILLYEATQNINWHKFKKFLAGGLTLAVLGVAMQVGILGVLFYYTCIGRFTHWADHAWTAAFLLAATLSSTDPVAVLSVLNAVNASDKLCTMFDGESLINDGSAVLLFQFFFFLLQGVAENPFSTFIMFVKLLFLGPAFGVAIGFVAYAWLLFFRKHPLTQCLAYITFCYISYFLAEAAFSLSGPLTAVCYGLFIKAYGHIALDRDAQSKHYTFVAALALMANCSIFVVSGIVTYGMMSSVFTREDGVTYWLHLLLTYVYLNVARIIMIVIFLPILRRTGYGLSWKEAVLLVWGGLRGGIVLALGLRIERDGALDADLTNTLSFFISGSVFLILLVNGMTFELLYRLLNPYPPKPFRRVYLEAVMRMIDHQYLEDRKALENHWLFKGTDVLAHADRVVPKLGWRKVDRLGNLDIKCPDITQAFMSLHEAAIYSWVVPNEQLAAQDGVAETDKSYGDASAREEETDRDGREISSTGSPAAPFTVSRSAAAASSAAAEGGLPEAAAPMMPSASRMLSPSPAHPASVSSSAGGPVNGLHLGLNEAAGRETGRDTNADVDFTASVVSSALDNPAGSPEAPLVRERDGIARKRTEAEQEKQAHSLAARGQGLKQSGSRGFDPKFNLRLIEHATTAAADREVAIHPDSSDKESSGVSEGDESVDVFEVTLQGEDPATRVPLYKLTFRGVGGTPAAEQPGGDRRRQRSMVDRALSTLRRVMGPRHFESTPAAPPHVPSCANLRRCRTVGAGTVRIEDRSRKPTPLGRNRTGIPMYRPRRADTMPSEGDGASNVNHFSPPFPTRAAGNAAADTRARRFDTDATIVFHDLSNGAWEAPRKHKRRFFSLLSGMQFNAKRRGSAAPTNTKGEGPAGPCMPPGGGAPPAPQLLPQSSRSQQNLRPPQQGPDVDASQPRRFSLLPFAAGKENPRSSLGGFVGALGKTKQEQKPQTTTPPPQQSPPPQQQSPPPQQQQKPQRRRGRKGIVAEAADNFEKANQTTLHPNVQSSENVQRIRTNASLGSSESYFELPMSPRQQGVGEGSYSRRKVLRKEREGELYLMIFNACREMYHRLYHKQCIGGSALLSLNTSLDLSNDFAVGKVRQNPIKAWATVLQEDCQEQIPRLRKANLTGFEYEWSVLQSRLHCLQYQRNFYCCFWRNMPSAFLRSLLNSGACQSDLEQLLAFVDVHEELLDKGGRNMELLMGRGLLTNYKQQILSAKRFVLYIRDCYPDSFRFAVCKVAATLLLNLKMKLVKDTASKGLVLEEDKEKLLQILDEQQFRLSRFKPCFILIRPQACLPMGGGHLGTSASTPISSSRMHSPSVNPAETEP